MSLAEFVDEHAEALNYDLITRTRYTVNDIGGPLSWGSLYSFLKGLGPDSATARELGKSTGWENTLKTNALLADIFDMLQIINANLVNYASGGKKKTKIKPYPRPGKDNDKTRKFGKGALPLNELRDWFRRKQGNG